MTKSSAILFVSACIVAAGACAQTCTTFDGSDTGSGGVFSGNTCGKNLALSSFCSGGNVTNGAGSSIIQVNLPVTDDRQLTVMSNTTGFNPELAFTGAPCSSLTACIVDDTNGTQTVGPDATPFLAPGSYFAIVSDLNAETPGCGDFNLVISVFTPVRLQAFSAD